MSKNILVLAPFAIVRQFHFPLVALAKTLREQGHTIIFVHCRQAMHEDCTAMQSRGLALGDGERKRALCAACLRAASYASKLYPWRTRWLLPLASSPEVPRPSLSRQELRRIAGYEIIISRKITRKKSDPEGMAAWESRYRQLRAILPQARQILEEEKADCLISYNSLYGIHRVFARLGEGMGIPSLCLHQSFSMQEEEEFILLRDQVIGFLSEVQRKARQGRVPRGQAVRDQVQQHLQGLFTSKKLWAYSLPKTETFQRRARGKRLAKVLVTISSPDELLGLKLLGLLPDGRRHAFAGQISWLRWIFSLAEKTPQVQFFIRPHPRLYPNKREAQTSDFLGRLERLKGQKRPANVLWPAQQDQGSLWDHLEDTDVLFNAWSTVGEVFAYQGIPVFTFFPHFSSSGEILGITSPDAAGYERKFRAIVRGWRPPGVAAEARRWLAALLTTDTFFLRWQTSRTLRLLRGLVPARFRETFEIATFGFSRVIADGEKIKKILAACLNPLKARKVLA